jgi:hypothetical protein
VVFQLYFWLARPPVFVVARLLRRADQVPDTLERQDTDALGLGGVLPELLQPLGDGSEHRLCLVQLVNGGHILNGGPYRNEPGFNLDNR